MTFIDILIIAGILAAIATAYLHDKILKQDKYGNYYLERDSR